MNERVEVTYAGHTIAPWCVEETCSGCGEPATHKIEETSGPETFHPLTAYVCCGCFQLVGACESYPYDADDAWESFFERVPPRPVEDVHLPPHEEETDG